LSTQGLISIINQDTKEVLVKIVAGSNGMYIDEAIEKIKPILNVVRLPSFLNRQERLQQLVSKGSLSLIFNRCLTVPFGAEDDLVIYSSTCMVSNDPEEELFPSRWKDTFNIPEFNPRWDRGTAAYFKIVEI